uniref:O-fucosyltransferase family protein n=1 Tax=Kalanchoe fedtschenkoi TaxID=63787 RepID=A0A7N0VFE4_KALFE
MKRSFSSEIPPVLHPLVSVLSLDSPLHSPKRVSSRIDADNHCLSSPPFLTHIFFLASILFSAIFFLMLTISISAHNQASLSLASLFGEDSGSTLPPHPQLLKRGNEETEFWKQDVDADVSNYKPRLHFSLEYRRMSVRASKEKRRFLAISVSGDLYQLRSQIIDAVVIARILRAALVVPVFHKDMKFGDAESEFSDIFDVEHFKRTLRPDVRIVASHPYTYLSSHQGKGVELPRHVTTPHWIATKLSKQLNDVGVLMLRGVNSELAGKLAPDLQKLRCKVAFHALRFANPVREIGHRLAKRLWIEGPYAALYLGLEEDAGLQTTECAGSSSRSLGVKNFDACESQTRAQQEERPKTWLVEDSDLLEMAKRLKGLGVPRHVTLYAASARPLGAAETLKPLLAEFPSLVTRETLARPGELTPFANSSTALAAIDYTITVNSDVFLTTPKSNIAIALQWHRAYTGKKKVIDLSHMRPESSGGLTSSKQVKHFIQTLF